MKKSFIGLLVVAFIFTALTVTYAYTINDLVDDPLNWQNPPSDRIGDAVFEIYGINVSYAGSNLIFDIYTNFPNNGVTVGAWNTFPGDLAIDADGNGTYEYGVAFTGKEGFIAGRLYNVNNWFTSNHYAPPSGYIYNENQIVTIASGTLLPNASSVAYYTNDPTLNRYNGIPDFDIRAQFDTTGLAGFNDGVFDVHYAVATCANDYVDGRVTNPVPEPASLSLIGLGLLGLLGLRKKIS